MQEDLEKWFSDTYEEYFDRIFRYILKRTQDISLAQDLTSETFYKVVRHVRAKGNEIEKLEGWLYTIAINEIRQHFRKQKRFFFFPMKEFQEVPSYETPASELQEWEDEKEKKAELTEALKLIKELPQLDQEIITLRFFEGKKTAEIADILGKKASAIRVRLHRLKDKIQQIIDS